MKNILSYLLLILLFACNAKKDRPTGQERQLQEQLIGDWVPVESKSSSLSNGVYFSEDYIPKGYTFYANGETENKQGYYKVAPAEGDTPNGRLKIHYLGSRTKFNISGDSLKIYNPADSTWENLAINYLRNDTLSIKGKEGIYFYRRAYYNLDTIPTFDAIILSTLGCYGRCPVTNTMVTPEGKMSFIGEYFTTKEGIYLGSISTKLYSELQDNYRRAAVNSIPAKFESDEHHMETILVTFVKDGKIYKTIRDYGNSGPKELVWAHIPLRFLHQQIDLEEVNAWDQATPLAYNLLGFMKAGKVLTLEPSESFLLWNYLRTGYKTDKAPRKRFEMKCWRNYHVTTYAYEASDSLQSRKQHELQSVTTDGQLYTFTFEGEKPLTIDIGFNFFDVNFEESDMVAEAEECWQNVPH
ncbi:DUF6438 domain-containing protein [Pontibacter anaerobius]|uniref:DUF6438 domain-containing protein n=1 Tax=Pontibacter anaerobius TaxID=2993940 RepID=A0ABT3RF97_9BACT|nr:DUF6438 domain-containing protein [Pontibacter anaerobius]MCX2739915.1 DUF6438 domain-containing protein [Pontibacter anaerobius]